MTALIEHFFLSFVSVPTYLCVPDSEEMVWHP